MSFYKYQEDMLFEAPNFVESPNYQLYAEQKDSYSYPVDGWIWLDTIEEAYEHFNIAPPNLES